jgi:polar amino acid transport system ATP-binding protein
MLPAACFVLLFKAMHTTATPRLPIIDLSLLRQGDVAREQLAAQLDFACREFGFFYLVGHGIDTARVDSLMSLSRQFFALNAEEKSRIHISKGGRAWRGYFRVGDELTSGIPDSKEGIYFGTELDAADTRVQAKTPLHGRNQFPALPGFKLAVLDYMQAVTDLGQQLFALLARSLGLADAFFVDNYTRDPTILFRIFNYPAGAALQFNEASWGVGAHTDYGLLTLLKQDMVGGLQVRHGDNWIDVPDVSNSFVCNVGDMLERLTRGRYLSALHRVNNVRDRDRLSMALFFDPSFDAKLVPIENVRPHHDQPHTQVRWDSIDPNLVNGTYGEYLLTKVAKVFPALRDDVL